MHKIILRHHRLILWLSALLTLLSIGICTRLRLDLNFLSLLPPHNPQVRAFMNVTEKIGLQSLLIAVVAPSDDTPARTAEALVDLLAQRFKQNPLIAEVEYKREDVDPTLFLPIFLRRFPHLLSPEALAELPERLTDEAVRRQVAGIRKLLLTPFGFAAKQMVAADPLGLAELLQQSLRLPSTALIKKEHEGFFSDSQGRYFIFIKPVEPPQDIAFSRTLMQTVKEIETAALQQARADWPELDPLPAVAYTGGYPIAVSDEAVTKKDIQISLVSSLIGVLALFGLCFRTFRTLVHVTVPLLMSIAWTLGLAGLLFGRLNLLTCIFSCVLAGLGIDFAVHIVNRFHSAEKRDSGPAERLEATFRETGSGIVVGAVTTALAFFAVGFSDFRGFRELGIMTGCGLLLCLAAMLFVLPALLVRGHGAARSKPVHLAGFGLPHLLEGMGRRPGVLLSAMGVLLLFFGILGFKAKFDDNLKNFRAPDNQALQLQEQMTQWLGGSSAASLLVVADPSEAGVLDRGAAIWSTLQELTSGDQLAGVAGMPGFFPSPADQQQNLAFVRNHADAFDWQRIRRSFDQALAAEGLQKLPAYDTYFNLLNTAFNDQKPVLPSDLMDTPLAPLLRMFNFETDGLYHTVLYVRPKNDLWSQQQVKQFKQTLENQLTAAGFAPDQNTLTGPQLLSAELKAVILRNLRTALILAVAAIVLVLLIFYRNGWLLAGALAPLAAGLAMLAGLMALLGVEFNFVNVIVLPMIVGIGIDDGVHLTNTFIANGHCYRAADLARTGRGVVLTSLTTMVGFGSISLSHCPGLKSMGYVAVLGVTACLFTSLFLLPPLLAACSKFARNRSAG